MIFSVQSNTLLGDTLRPLKKVVRQATGLYVQTLNFSI